MHVAHCAQPSVAQVRHDQLVHRLRYHRDFLQDRRPLGIDLRLDDVEAALLEQPAELVDARILFFAAGQVHRRQAVQFGELIEIESRQRLLEKEHVEALEFLHGVDARA